MKVMAVGFTVLVIAMTSGCSKSLDDPSAIAAPHATPPPRAANADVRAPVPLTETMAVHQKTEMRDHLRVIQEITRALGHDDFDTIAKSAERIAWSESQAAMCKHMGAGAPGFSDMGERFHHTATTIVESARRRDRPAVGAALDATITTCVGCHDTFRQQIVDSDAFAKIGGAADCPMHGKPGEHSM